MPKKSGALRVPEVHGRDPEPEKQEETPHMPSAAEASSVAVLQVENKLLRNQNEAMLRKLGHEDVIPQAVGPYVMRKFRVGKRGFYRKGVNYTDGDVVTVRMREDARPPGDWTPMEKAEPETAIEDAGKSPGGDEGPAPLKPQTMSGMQRQVAARPQGA